MLRLNNQLSHQVIWFQVLNHLMIKCCKEDYSHIQILTDIDLEETIHKFQLIAHTELRSQTDKEMDSSQLMETKVVNSIMTQIWIKNHITTVNMLRVNRLFQEKLEDIQLKQISTLKQVTSTECSQKNKKKHSAIISVDHFQNAERISRRT